MIKTICDACGKEIDTQKLPEAPYLGLIPFPLRWADVQIRGQEGILHLCPDCVSRVMLGERPVCRWEIDGAHWRTDCGCLYHHDDTENKWYNVANYCPNCGKEIVLVNE